MNNPIALLDNTKNKEIRINIYLLIFSMYYIGTMIFDLNERFLSVSQVLLIMMIMSSLWLAVKKRALNLRPYFWFMAMILLTFYVTALTGINYENSALRLDTILKILIMSIAVYQILFAYITERYIERLYLISGIILFAWVLYIYGVSEFITSILSGKERLGAEVSQENVMGMNASIIASVLLYYVLNKKKYSYLAVIAMMITIVAASGSKKALFTIPIAVLVILIQKNGMKKLYKVLVGIIVIGMCFMFLIKLPIFGGLNERINIFLLQLQGVNVDLSTNMRSDMIKYGLIWFTENPLLGIGIDNYRFLSGAIFDMPRYAHNNYIELLVGTGVLGFTAYYVVYLYLLSGLLKLHKEKNQVADIMLLVLIIQLFCDIASVSYLFKSTYIYFIIAFACIRKAKIDTLARRNTL